MKTAEYRAIHFGNNGLGGLDLSLERFLSFPELNSIVKINAIHFNYHTQSVLSLKWRKWHTALRHR